MEETQDNNKKMEEKLEKIKMETFEKIKKINT